MSTAPKMLPDDRLAIIYSQIRMLDKFLARKWGFHTLNGTKLGLKGDSCIGCWDNTEISIHVYRTY